MWVQVAGNKIGRTEGTPEAFFKADPRLLAIRTKWLSGERTFEEASAAIKKITGLHRLESDWREANKDVPVPEGRDKQTFELETYEAWLSKKPMSYRKVYYNSDAVEAFVLCKEEKK